MRALGQANEPLRRLSQLGSLSLFLLTLAGCSAHPAVLHQSSLEALVKARGLDPADITYPDRLTPEMRRWLAERFPRRSRSPYDAYRLLQYLEDKKELGLEYEAGHTGTAAEVFASRKFNCLSFSHLFLAMAREIGVDARYLSIDRIRRFRRQGDVVVVSGHITVGFGIGTDRRVLQFNVGPEVDYKTVTPISDATALALFHSNRGAELIQRGRHAEAIEWLETGVKIDPYLASTRVNLGVARRRNGDTVGAERDYLRAIEVDDGFFPAYRNLASLHKSRGNADTALELFSVIDRRGNRNPFAYLALGDQSLELGQTEEAKSYYRRALKLSTDRTDAQAALGILALEVGAIEDARRWYKKASRSDSPNERVSKLERLLFTNNVSGGSDPGA